MSPSVANDRHCSADRWAIRTIVGTQVAYPVVYLSLALIGGFDATAAGAVIVAIPLTATIMVGATGWLTRWVIDGQTDMALLAGTIVGTAPPTR